LEIVELPIDTKGIFIKPFVEALAVRLRERLELAFCGQTEALESGDLQIRWRVMHEQTGASSEKVGRKTRLYETNA